MRQAAFLLAGLAIVLAAGCGPSFGPKAAHGITFYSPGAGNMDFGDHGLRQGLQKAGYEGQVATNMWTVSFNPAIDQALRINAVLGGKKLARYIEKYIDRYPSRPVNLVGLSAGTGVTVWALEKLKDGYKVDNVVLLASSLSSDYDVSKALRRVKGKIYNYYSPNDAILTVFMVPFGTIDGKLGADGAGAVGFETVGGSDRLVNIRWRSEYKRYGYYGGHTDGTNAAFVRAVISRNLLAAPKTVAVLDAAHANPAPTVPPVARRD